MMRNSVTNLAKHGNHDQSTHSPHGQGARGLLANLPMQLNPVSAAVDEVFRSTTNMAAANDLARAKSSIWAGSRASEPKVAAQALGTARLAIGSAARKLSGTSTPSAIKLSDASQRLKIIVEGLKGPEGG
jgi:hypothetical protein